MASVIHAIATSAEIEQIATLARRIWTQHYVPIIGAAQVEYMLQRFQSATAIKQQIDEGHEYFSICMNAGDDAVGYMDVVAQPASGKLFLSKLYVSDDARGNGLGRQLFDHALALARQRRLSTLWLTVNKFNPSLQIYLRWGMVNAGSIVKEIGYGFVMDDYQLELAV
jgi:GNAT superfamily N-acetyltransferase